MATETIATYNPLDFAEQAIPINYTYALCENKTLDSRRQLLILQLLTMFDQNFGSTTNFDSFLQGQGDTTRERQRSKDLAAFMNLISQLVAAQQIEKAYITQLSDLGSRIAEGDEEGVADELLENCTATVTALSLNMYETMLQTQNLEQQLTKCEDNGATITAVPTTTTPTPNKNNDTLQYLYLLMISSAQEKNQYLFQAVKDGKSEAVKIMLNSNADPNAVDSSGQHPLDYAARNGNLDIVKLLASYRANLTSSTIPYGESPIYYAAGSGSLGVVNWLLDNGVPIEIKDNAGVTPLLNAATRGESNTFVGLVERGADIHVVDKAKVSALHYAAYGGNIDIVKYLGRQGANLTATNVYGDTALHYAAGSGHVDIVDWLIDNGTPIDVRDNRKKTPLLNAASNGQYGTFTELVKRGANVDAVDKDGITAIEYAVLGGNLDLLKYIAGRGGNLSASTGVYGENTLYYAAGSGHVDILDWLLSKGVPIDIRDNAKVTPLMNAATHGEFNTFMELVKKGANMKAVDGAGLSALHYAAIGGNTDIIKYLYNASGGVNLLDRDVYGQTGLHYAARYDHLDAVNWFIDNGVPIDVKDNSGATPLMAAAGSGSLDVVKILLYRGADKNEKDKKQRTAYDYAKSSKHDDVAQYLSQAK